MNIVRKIVGHGQLLKALNSLPGVTDQKFRIAATHLAHAKPPEYRVYIKTSNVARLVGCSSRSVELCRTWLQEAGAAHVMPGGGRGRSTTVDFLALAQQINPEATFGVSVEKSPKLQTETPKLQTETPKPRAPYKEEGPLKKDHNKDHRVECPEIDDAAADRVKQIRAAIRRGEPRFRILAGFGLNSDEFEAIEAKQSSEEGTHNEIHATRTSSEAH